MTHFLSWLKFKKKITGNWGSWTQTWTQVQ